jgi:heptosyltransferase III
MLAIHVEKLKIEIEDYILIDLKNKKILLVRNDNVGDLICTTPAIEALRKKYPNNQIDIVVNSYNYDAIHNNPFVNKIYCYTKPKES